MGWMGIGLRGSFVENAGNRIAKAARDAAKRSGGGGGGTKPKGDDLAEFKRKLLAEVRSTIVGTSAASSGPTSRRSSTVESDDSGGVGSEGQSTAAIRERLGTEIQDLRRMLGPDHVEVTKRCAELENLRRQRPLHTRVLDGQRRIEKASKKVEMRQKELAEAEKTTDLVLKRGLGNRGMIARCFLCDVELVTNTFLGHNEQN